MKTAPGYGRLRCLLQVSLFVWVVIAVWTTDGHAAGTPQSLVDIRPVEENGLFRVIMDFKGPAPAHTALILEAPPRLVVDLKRAGLAYDEAMLLVGNEFLDSIRVEKHTDKVRVILGLNVIDRLFYRLEKKDSQIIVVLAIYRDEAFSFGQGPGDAAANEPDPATPGASGYLEDGQDPDAIEQAFTDTATQVASGEEHPPEPAARDDDFQIDKEWLEEDWPEDVAPAESGAGDAASAEGSRFDRTVQGVVDGLSWEFRTLFNLSNQNNSDSGFNADNLLSIPTYQFETNLRPDIYLNYQNLRAFIKPRVDLIWRRWDEGPLSSGSDWNVELLVNEWMAGYSLHKNLFASYGRENIQWGPAYFVSPSNQFFIDNGMANPKQEVRGKDFGRVLFSPSKSFSMTLLANTGPGADERAEDDFNKGYALKLDYSGYRKYVSLIPTIIEDDREYLGFYAGWTILDGLLIYGEGSFAQGTSARYPVVRQVQSPSGSVVKRVSLEATQTDSNDLVAESLLGISYTLQSGPTFVAEYYLNTAGYTDEETAQLTQFAQQTESEIDLPSNLIARLIPMEFDFDLGLRRLRQHYLNFQYQHAQAIVPELNFFLRCSVGLDDWTQQLIPVVEYELNQYFQIFGVGTWNFGKGEFSLLVDSSLFFGVQYTY